MWLLPLLACDPVARQPVEDVVVPRGEMPEVTPEPPSIRRLTAVQYANAVHDIFGESVRLSTSLEPDERVDGLQALGASVVTVSPYGVGQYEDSAYDIAAQVVGNAALRDRWFPCAGVGAVDYTCLRADLPAYLTAVWRRPPTDAELSRMYWIAGLASANLGSHWDGVTYVIAASLQSPNFLYRAELGEPDPADPAVNRFTDAEMASRLAFFLWNTTPDAELLRAASAGELTTDEGLGAQVDRMLADSRAKQGTRAFFTDMFTLDELDDLSKDTTIFLHMDETVGPSAREETLSTLDWIVWQQDGDYRDLLTTRTTFINRKLAAIYNVAAPTREGFGQTEYDADLGRVGLLGQASVLALHAHPTSSSVTRRGLFVREVLLCQDLPPPPANVDTSIPAPTADAPTMRDRVAQHLADPNCASCHTQTDPIGLALENFDGLGGWRDDDGGAPIDASGDLDGDKYDNAVGLAQAVHDNAALGPCLTTTLYEYATGHAGSYGEGELLDWHGKGFAESGYRVQFLLRDIVMAPGFRQVGAVE